MSGLLVAVDTEGSGLYPDEGARISVVSYAYRKPDGTIRSAALAFGQGTDNLLYTGDEGEERWDELMIWLSSQRLIFHNAKYDLHMLGAGALPGHAGAELGRRFWWDTMVAQRHCDPLDPVGLDATCKRLGIGGKDDAFLNYIKKHRLQKAYHLVPWDVMEPYARKDAEDTLALYEHQQVRIDDPEEWPDREWIMREFEVTRCLYRMEQRGIGFDAAGCMFAADELAQAMKAAATDLPFKPSSVEAARRYYFNDPRDGGLGLLWNKATAGTAGKKNEKPALDAEVRRQLVEAEAPHAAAYDRWCELETAYSMWYHTWPSLCGPDGRLRPSFRQTKVVSGRFSIERVQLQAIPHDYQLDQLLPGLPTIRSFFGAKDGHQLWELDLSQAEVRVATWDSGCKQMRAAIERGDDAHDATCRLIFGVDKDDPNWKRLRACAKRIRLGTIYGGGAGKIQSEIKRIEGLDVPIDQVKQWIAADRRAFPEFVSAAYRAQKVAETHGYIPLAAGGYRWFTDFERRFDSHKAFNQKIQGSVAMVMNEWMLQVEQRWPGTLLLQIHDSLVVELPTSGAQVIAELMAVVGEGIFRQHFGMPFVAEAKEWG